jgi:Lipocalin-like domain
VKKRGLVIVLSGLLGVVLLCACGKDGIAGPDQTKLLAGDTAKVWRLDRLLENGVDTTALLLPCDRDDYLTFRADGTYALTEGPTRCNPTDTFLVEAGSWALAENTLLLTPTRVGVSVAQQIDTLNATRLVVRYSLGQFQRRAAYIPR